MAEPLTDKVLLIGWDAADWKIITPLVDSGAMPNLKRFLERGVMGNLSTLVPVLSPMLWTSIATGKRAYKHGVHGFSEPDRDSGRVRPVSNLCRRTKAVWNILNQNGRRSNVIGWWPSHPVEPINGVMVSNHYHTALRALDHPWPMPPGTVHPPRLAKALAQLRVHPWEIEAEQLLPFVPQAAGIDQDKDKRLFAIARLLAECASVHAAATAVMELEPWDFTAVYYDAIDHFCHGFMKYHPPRLPWIPREDYELYKNVVVACYRFHDMMLGALMRLAGEETTVILCSDHGFHPDHLRPLEIPNEPAGAAEEHRPFGIFAMCGPGVRRDELVFGASLLDVTPTILASFGLPSGRDMDGRVLVTAFGQPPELEFVESWDSVAGDDGSHPAGRRADPIDSAEAMRQLADLGYIDTPDEDAQRTAQNTLRELRYNLARDLIDARRPGEAMPVLESLWEQWPEESRFGVQLFGCMLNTGRTDDARRTLDTIRARKRHHAEKAGEELASIAAAAPIGDAPAEEPARAERVRRMRLRRRAATNHGSLSYLEGRLYLAEGEAARALECFDRIGEVQVHNQPSLLYARAEALLKLSRWAEAAAAFAAMLEIDPVNANARLGLCRTWLGRRRPRRALDEALAAIGLVYHNPRAHYCCGIACQWLGRVDDAVRAFETAASQNLALPDVHRRLARLYRTRLGDAQLADRHRVLAAEAGRRQRGTSDSAPASPSPGGSDARLGAVGKPKALPPVHDEIIVVSGLPRSGTSMMMQMLNAGGCSLLADDKRGADSHNPRGYYEFQAVKSIGRDDRWMHKARGRAVKIVAPLLESLPSGFRYRVIFMERGLSEVIVSQRVMLEAIGKPGATSTPERLGETYRRQIAQVRDLCVEKAGELQCITVDYHQALTKPNVIANRVNAFLGGGLDCAAMMKAVEPALCRQRSG